jgi:group II intron reverse transcriptase/maturase
MRKNREQQEKRNKRQLGLFDCQKNRPEESQSGGTGKGIDLGVELSSRLERERTLTTHIMERIVENTNLNKAYQEVVRNGGSGGVDGMEIEEFKQWYGKNINSIRETILSEQYEVSPVRKVEIPKTTGGTRVLGIPTIKDRFIQQAITCELSKHYEPYFSENSYGFRPGRSAHQAIEQAAQYIKEGKEWVVDIDLENFFDTINHDRLMQRLSKTVSDKKLLRLINAYLKAGMMEGGITEQRISGTPQGSPLSPLLSNIVLDELDKELERRKHNFCRYADDCNIYVGSRKAGERVMETIVKFIEKKLKLKVNRSKSGVKHCSEVKFLGYTILSGGGIRVADKAIDRFKDKVRMITRRNRGVKFEQIIKELNLVLVGWSNYFRLANKWLGNIKALDGWIRRKLRCYRLKQCGRKYTIVKYLRNLGCPESKSWNVVMYSQGWWNMSKKPAVGHAMSVEWFTRLGLQSFTCRMEL